MATSISDYYAPILPLKKPYFTGSHGIERVKQSSVFAKSLCEITGSDVRKRDKILFAGFVKLWRIQY